MDFKQVKKWKIPEGDVLSVTDSNNNILWEAPLQWNLEDGSTLTVRNNTNFEVNVINPKGEQFAIICPRGIYIDDISQGDYSSVPTEVGYYEFDINGVIGKCTITFRASVVMTKNQVSGDFILKDSSGEIVSSVTITVTK